MKNLKRTVKPWLEVFRRFEGDLSLRMRSQEKIFTEVYEKRGWGNQESLSGPGSNLAQTEAIREAIPALIKELGIRSMLDVPCGDFYWMSQVELNVEYTGGDIVGDLIEENRKRYGRDGRKFIKLNLIRDCLPAADLILCRDCWIHFSYSDIFKALRNVVSSGATYFLTTTFVGRDSNTNIATGKWRPINLELSPFNFPPPIRLVNERCTLGGNEFSDKCLGLWAIAGLTL